MPRIEKNVIVANKKGLHARPAAMFVQLADKFGVNVTLVKGEERVNGKSIMGLLMLGAQHETPLTIIVEGDSAEAAMAEFENFFSKQEEDLVK
jgi:phosphocarrier protein HPr